MNARIIELPKILDQRGNLTFIEEENHIPFKIERTFWIYDVPGGENRGGVNSFTPQCLVQWRNVVIFASYL